MELGCLAIIIIVKIMSKKHHVVEIYNVILSVHQSLKGATTQNGITNAKLYNEINNKWFTERLYSS